MKSNPPISLLLADVDGTLVTQEKVITPRARAAVSKLREAGIAFAITSGRPPLGMKMVIEDLKIETPIAGFNGGVFVSPDFTVLARRLLPAATAARTIEVILAHKLAAWLYTEKDWFIPDPKGPHVAREAWTVKFEAKVVAYGEEAERHFARHHVLMIAEGLVHVAVAGASIALLARRPTIWYGALGLTAIGMVIAGTAYVF